MSSPLKLRKTSYFLGGELVGYEDWWEEDDAKEEEEEAEYEDWFMVIKNLEKTDW